MKLTARRLLGNGAAASVVETLIASVLLFVTFRIVIRESSLTTFGIWALIQSLTAVVRMADVGVAGSLAKYVGQLAMTERQAKVWRYVDSGIVFNACFFVILSGIAYVPLILILRSSLAADQARLAVSLLPLVLFNLVLMSLSGVPIAALIGLRRGTAKSIINIGGALVLLVATMVLLPPYQLSGLIVAQTCQIAVTLVIAWAVLTRELDRRRWFRMRLSFDPAVIRETVSVSLIIQVNTVLAQLADVVVKLALTSWGGAASTGLYELVNRFITVARSLMLGPTMLGVPLLARAFVRHRHRAVARIYERQVLLTGVAAALVYTGIIVAAPVVCYVVLGRMEPDFFVYFGIMWVITLINVISIPAVMLGPASGKLRGNLIANVILIVGTILSTNLAGYLAGATAALLAGGGMVVIASVLTMIWNGRAHDIRVLPGAASIRRLFRPGGMRALFSPILR